MSNLIVLHFEHGPRRIRCQHCGETVDRSEYNGDTDECNECHDNGPGFDECGCPRCYDNQTGLADFYEEDR